MAASGIDNLSDEELVELCQKRLPGDTRPFTALVKRYQQQVLTTCFRLMGNRQDAEDQAQEVFIRVYRGLRRFEGRAKFSTWLYQITINTCHTALKKRATRSKYAETSLSTLHTVASPLESPEDTVLAQADLDLLTQALQTLNDEERAILTLRETNGLNYREIAEVLGIGLSAAKMRALRARLSLQRSYRELAGVEQ
jgi:RNA polymerase sigma-70 factor (ECF subfamily)